MFSLSKICEKVNHIRFTSVLHSRKYCLHSAFLTIFLRKWASFSTFFSIEQKGPSPVRLGPQFGGNGWTKGGRSAFLRGLVGLRSAAVICVVEDQGSADQVHQDAQNQKGCQPGGLDENVLKLTWIKRPAANEKTEQRRKKEDKEDQQARDQENESEREGNLQNLFHKKPPVLIRMLVLLFSIIIADCGEVVNKAKIV